MSSQVGEAPELAEVQELLQDATELGVGVAEVALLRERVAAAESWASGAAAHLARFPPTSAQPMEALPAARELIAVSASGIIDACDVMLR